MRPTKGSNGILNGSNTVIVEEPYSDNVRPPRTRTNSRAAIYPLFHSSRKKPRRWPLVARFVKGAIHTEVFPPVLLHAAFATLIVYVDNIKDGHLGLPSSAIPSLSIVVGLMLVFRNQTSYERFWKGNQHFSQLATCIRNLTRSFLTTSQKRDTTPTEAERADTERTVRILLALIYATKNHLRAEWGSSIPLLLSQTDIDRMRRESTAEANREYSDLLPAGTKGFEDQGLGLVLQLSIQIEAYIKRGCDRGWFHAPQASQMMVQLNTLLGAYSSMETIHLTPLPVALLIHIKQVLAIFCCMLPFALVKEMGWWTVLIVAFVAFTLYGIEAIGVQLEDPFGYDKNDIKVDAIAEDLNAETSVLLSEWRRRGPMFQGLTV